MGSFQLLDHVGEVELVLRAGDLGELLRQACRGLAEVMAGGPAEGSRDLEERVSVAGRDPEDLLVALLDELIFRSEQAGCVFDELRVESLSGNALDARISGSRRRLATPVKAATFHGLVIRPVPEGIEARVVLDV